MLLYVKRDSCFIDDICAFCVPPLRLPLLVPLRKHCVDTHLWTIWLKRRAPCCRTRHRSTRCWVISTASILQTCRLERDGVKCSAFRVWCAFRLTGCSFCWLPYRSRHHGCASVRRGWFSTWSRTSRPRYSSRAPWSSGRPGWRTWSPRCSSLTNTGPASPGRLGSSCSSGPSTGLQEKNTAAPTREKVTGLARFSCDGLHVSAARW